MQDDIRVTILESLEQRYYAVDDAYETMNALQGVSVESPLWSVIFNILDDYIALISDKLECDIERLSWWIYENDFGHKGLSYESPTGEVIVCNDIPSFLKTI